MYAPFSSIFDHTQRPKPQKMQWKYEEEPSVRQSHMFTHK